MSRLRRMDGAVALEDSAGCLGDNSPFADEVDEIQANEGREIGFATRTLLVERVHKLRNALEHLREGDTAPASRAGEPIAAARLRAVRRSRRACGAGPDRALRASARAGGSRSWCRRGRRVSPSAGAGRSWGGIEGGRRGPSESRETGIGAIRSPFLYSSSRALRFWTFSGQRAPSRRLYLGLVSRGRNTSPGGCGRDRAHHQTFADPVLVTIPVRRPIYYWRGVSC